MTHTDAGAMLKLADEMATDATNYVTGSRTRKLLHKAADALRQAASQGKAGGERASIIEECAKIAESHKWSEETKAATNGARTYGNDGACENIAAAIRALSPPVPKTGGEAEMKATCPKCGGAPPHDLPSICDLHAALPKLTAAGENAAVAQAALEPIARAHITLEDDGPYATLEVLNGELLQPSMSPVNLYASPPAALPAGEDIDHPDCRTDRERELYDALMGLASAITSRQGWSKWVQGGVQIAPIVHKALRLDTSSLSSTEGK